MSTFGKLPTHFITPVVRHVQLYKLSKTHIAVSKFPCCLASLAAVDKAVEIYVLTATSMKNVAIYSSLILLKRNRTCP